MTHTYWRWQYRGNIGPMEIAAVSADAERSELPCFSWENDIGLSLGRGREREVRRRYRITTMRTFTESTDTASEVWLRAVGVQSSRKDARGSQEDYKDWPAWPKLGSDSLPVNITSFKKKKIQKSECRRQSYSRFVVSLHLSGIIAVLVLQLIRFSIVR